MNDGTTGFIVGLILATFIFGFVSLEMYKQAKKDIRIEAVDRGYGVWKVDNTGATEFQWK